MTFPRRAGIALLTAREPLTPRMLRVPLRCDAVGADWPVEQPGESITLLFVPPDEAIVLPERGWRFPDGTPPQEWRNYTVRRHRPEAGGEGTHRRRPPPRGGRPRRGGGWSCRGGPAPGGGPHPPARPPPPGRGGGGPAPPPPGPSGRW